jgi:hypothetical protein
LPNVTIRRIIHHRLAGFQSADDWRYLTRRLTVRRRGGNRRPWSWFHRLQERFRLPTAVTVHSTYRKRSERFT